MVCLNEREGVGSGLEKASEESGVKKDDSEVVWDLGGEGSGCEGDGRVDETKLVGDLVTRAKKVGRGYDGANRQDSEVEDWYIDEGWSADDTIKEMRRGN